MRNILDMLSVATLTALTSAFIDGCHRSVCNDIPPDSWYLSMFLFFNWLAVLFFYNIKYDNQPQ